jgi:uncharacterized integral membrane protein
MTEERPTRDIDEMVAPEPRSAISVGTVFALIAIALFVVFIVQNMDSIGIRFMGVDVVAPTWLVSLIVFALGFVVGYVVKTLRVRKKRRAAAAKVA